MIFSHIAGILLATSISKGPVIWATDSTPLTRHTRTEGVVGLASYYGYGFQGRLTASGEVYDPNDLTAAHRTLPFGTEIQVTNLKNNRSVVVTITDRGPALESRILDLSLGSARKLKMVGSGVVPVRIRVLK